MYIHFKWYFRFTCKITYKIYQYIFRLLMDLINGSHETGLWETGKGGTRRKEKMLIKEEKKQKKTLFCPESVLAI